MVPKDLNIGFQGLALIHGQIYNPDFPLNPGWLIGILEILIMVYYNPYNWVV